MSEAVAPDVHERLEVATVGSFQRGEVFGATGFGLRGEFHAGQIEGVIAHEHGDLERLRKIQPFHRHDDFAPAVRPFRHEFARDSAVQVERQMFAERRGGKGLLLGEGEFVEGDPLGQQ